MMIYQRHYSLR